MVSVRVEGTDNVAVDNMAMNTVAITLTTKFAVTVTVMVLVTVMLTITAILSSQLWLLV